MDIDLLSKMVGELILDSDEVALPGVGTFVAEVVPSTFSDKGYTINPPYRRLSFRQRESSDNSLVEFYARSNGVDERTAASILRPFLAELKETLKVKKTIIFPGLGRLRATRENNFFFIPDEDINIYPEGFGLEPLSLKTHVETEDEMRAAVASLQQILDEPVVEEEEVAPAVAEAAPVVEEEAAPVVEEEAAPVVEEEVAPVVEETVPAAVEPEVPEPAEVYEEVAPVVEEEPAPAVEAANSAGPAPVKVVEDVQEEDYGWDDEEDYRSWRRRRSFIIAGIVLVSLLVLFIVGFIVLAHIAPDFIDSILYTDEELDIIRKMSL
jgi:Predicted membrane protein